MSRITKKIKRTKNENNYEYIFPYYTRIKSKKKKIYCMPDLHERVSLCGNYIILSRLGRHTDAIGNCGNICKIIDRNAREYENVAYLSTHTFYDTNIKYTNRLLKKYNFFDIEAVDDSNIMAHKRIQQISKFWEKYTIYIKSLDTLCNNGLNTFRYEIKKGDEDYFICDMSNEHMTILHKFELDLLWKINDKFKSLSIPY